MTGVIGPDRGGIASSYSSGDWKMWCLLPQSGAVAVMRRQRRALVLLLMLAGLALSQESVSNGGTAKGAATPGDAAGLTLVRDEFSGNGLLLRHVPDEDIQGGGWLSADMAVQPRLDGKGGLISGGHGSIAAIQLPPISPYAELTVTATLALPGSALALGFTDSPHHFAAGANGPWLRFTGDGKMDLSPDAITKAITTDYPRPAGNSGPVTLSWVYSLAHRTIRILVNGKTVETLELAVPPAADYRFFAIEFMGDDANAIDGTALSALRIEYVPRARPLRMIPQRTIQVTDTSMAGITKAMVDANALSGPGNTVEISIPKGEYHFQKPDNDDIANSQIFWIFGLKNLIINWNGSSIIIDNPRQGLQNLSNATNVTVKDIASIDYSESSLPFTQGAVQSINDDQRTFELEVDKGFPLPDNAYFTKSRSRAGESWGQLIDPVLPGRRKAGAFMEYWIKEVQPVGDHIFRYVMKTPLVGFRKGDRFADCPRWDRQTFRVVDSERVTLEDITAYACSGFFCGLHKSSEVNVIDLQIRVKPGRLMSLNGDIVTGSLCRMGPWIERCHFEGNGDDICHQFSAAGIFITASTFRNNRRFGVWFNSSEFGVVTDCSFDGIGSFAIVGMKEPGMESENPFASRNVLCCGNTIRNMWGPAISLSAINTKEDPSPQWNAHWRFANNATSAPIQIRNASDVLGISNSEGKLGEPARFEIETATCRDVRQLSTRSAGK